MRNGNSRRWTGATALLSVATLLAACSSGSAADADAPTRDGILADVCPATVVIQADWEPESEHGGIYNLLGDDHEVDTAAKSVSGPLLAGGTDTGVDVEIRIGGSSVGYQSAQALLYQDRDIMLGYGRVTEFMIAQEATPVTAVMATLEKSPYAVYWDPETYPDVETIADLKTAGATVLVGSGEDVWIDYLIGTGQLDESQIDRSDAPKPATFVAAAGAVAEAGFITAEPFMYEKEIADWGKPVTGQLLADAGYPEYFQALVVRTGDVTEQADCLAALVPVLQQAQADYATDPSVADALIVDLVEQYDTGWVYTPAQAEFAATTQLELGILANSSDGVMGKFDLDRVGELIEIIGEHSDNDVSGITPEDLVTNEFIDEGIAM